MRKSTKTERTFAYFQIVFLYFYTVFVKVS